MSKSSGYLLQLLQTQNIFTLVFKSISPKSDFADDAIRILARFLESESILKKIEECKVNTADFIVEIKQTIKQAYEKKIKDRLVNSCTMLSRFLKKYPKHISETKDIIALLISTVKDEVGLIRKNAAILLSIIASDDKNKEIVRDLHGIEVLSSVKDFL